ncbi:hypothetical protein [Singulisphaera acidiphila]|uniref:Uncharacterized protein n=1 Tax=Singulisphaera acidiphila (strain ATCC BAA-1392 / DSM 18658 / VKM B-2454 / MOB10) TaxID=886293 RepID=L0DC97_SINAD|nr:hypothetical protein [Singulisphaera acidiphila]AGA26453.1 hypothetical protein Sinac_2118 [Singulisphaera acidiphila DSM 18658]
MSRVEDYLAISESYCRWLGDLRWCPTGEAVEYACDGPEIGLTFAMAAEISLFLEGFHSSARPISFSFILHLLRLLGLGTRIQTTTSIQGPATLEQAFREWGLPLRNAGALCARLCCNVPRVPDPPDLSALHLALTRPLAEPFGEPRTGVAVLPPLDPPRFERLIIQGVSELTSDELRHWLRYGRGAIHESVAERVATLPRPRTLSAVLAALEHRPRLAGTTSLAVHLAGALTLPPRRLTPASLPMGGYSDVATRGQPERIVPTQLALEGDEFVRRFAEHELLFYQREEPRIPVPEEVVVVLDQGVLTWGAVRLVLGAAAMALGRQAERRKIPFSIAATSREGRAVDPRQLDEEELGALLESSDLSPDPGLTLKTILEQRGESRLRDVVLLTHPRTLREPAVVAAARRVETSTRLFAVTVNGEGCVALSELSRGAAVVRSTLRVPLPRENAPAPAHGTENAEPASWQGDIETPGFPFVLGALGPIPGGLFDFDGSGKWILFTGQQGLLHACRIDGTRMEMLPRVLLKGHPLSRVESIVGVAGGFVVVGKCGSDYVIGCYDFSTRCCTAHSLGTAMATKPEWSYLRSHEALVARNSLGPIFALDLSARPEEWRFPPLNPTDPVSNRAKRAFHHARSHLPDHSLAVPSLLPLPVQGFALRLHESNGAIDIQNGSGVVKTIIPTLDGRPSLQGNHILSTRRGGDVIVAVVADRVQTSLVSLLFFSTSSFRVIANVPCSPKAIGFAISADGQYFARKSSSRHLEVKDVTGESTPIYVSPKGRSHQRVNVRLGKLALVIYVGEFIHLIRWDRPVLELTQGRGNVSTFLAQKFDEQSFRTVPAPRGRSPLTTDSKRFLGSCSFSGLSVHVDFIGQVSVLGKTGELVCMFYMFRNQLAGWMPDGTRIGPAHLTGGPATENGEASFRTALQEASGVEGSQSP